MRGSLCAVHSGLASIDSVKLSWFIPAAYTILSGRGVGALGWAILPFGRSERYSNTNRDAAILATVSWHVLQVWWVFLFSKKRWRRRCHGSIHLHHALNCPLCQSPCNLHSLLFTYIHTYSTARSCAICINYRGTYSFLNKNKVVGDDEQEFILTHTIQ